jgi:hypothetical protein
MPEVAQTSQVQTPSTGAPAKVSTPAASTPSTQKTPPQNIGSFLDDAKKTLGRQSKTQPEPVINFDEVFSYLQEKVDQMPDYSNTQGFDPYGNVPGVDTSQVEGAQLAQQALGEMQADAAKDVANAITGQQDTQTTEEGPLYTFKGKLGEEEIEYDFDNQEELDKAIQRGFAADKVFQAYSKLQEKVGEYQAKAEKLDAFDNLCATNPLKAVELVVEDMLEAGKESELKQWMISMADYLSKSQEEKAQIAKIKEADRYKEQLALHKQQLQEIENQKRRAIVEADVQQLRSWAKTSLDKYTSKLPEGMGPWLQGQIKDIVALNRRNGAEISYDELSRQLATRVRPLLNISRRKMDNEIGKAIDAKKDQNLSVTQSVASRGIAPRTTGRPGIDEFISKGDVSGLSRFLADSVNSGRLRVLNDK